MAPRHRSSRHGRSPARSRSQSPLPSGHHRRRERTRSPIGLPYRARQLSKHDLEEYLPLFESYLDLQKRLHLDELSDREVKGRWKSFVGRWNRRELDANWYDPVMLERAKRSPPETHDGEGSRSNDPGECRLSQERHHEDNPASSPVRHDSDSDSVGPALPPSVQNSGPSIPTFADLQLRNESRETDRAERLEDTRYERKMDRRTQKARLEEMAPRADPGSHERRLEKKRETTTTLKDYRNAKDGGDADVGDADLLGEDEVNTFKKQKNEMQRKKNERELRREEIMRARAAEWEERLAERKAKEDRTMQHYQALVKERFG